jgi:hypothetical protein
MSASSPNRIKPVAVCVSKLLANTFPSATSCNFASAPGIKVVGAVSQPRRFYALVGYKGGMSADPNTLNSLPSWFLSIFYVCPHLHCLFDEELRRDDAVGDSGNLVDFFAPHPSQKPF